MLTTFPDACIIQTHRDPVKSVASNLSLNLRLLGIKNIATEHFLAKASMLIMEDYAQTLERAIEIRKQADPARFFDVYYSAMIKEPIETIHAIYDHFDYGFADVFQKRIAAWLDKNPQGKHGTHRYSLETFGLTRDMINDRFAFYCEYFGIRPEE